MAPLSTLLLFWLHCVVIGFALDFICFIAYFNLISLIGINFLKFYFTLLFNFNLGMALK